MIDNQVMTHADVDAVTTSANPMAVVPQKGQPCQHGRPYPERQTAAAVLSDVAGQIEPKLQKAARKTVFISESHLKMTSTARKNPTGEWNAPHASPQPKNPLPACASRSAARPVPKATASVCAPRASPLITRLPSGRKISPRSQT